MSENEEKEEKQESLSEDHEEEVHDWNIEEEVVDIIEQKPPNDRITQYNILEDEPDEKNVKEGSKKSGELEAQKSSEDPVK